MGIVNICSTDYRVPAAAGPFVCCLSPVACRLSSLPSLPSLSPLLSLVSNVSPVSLVSLRGDQQTDRDIAIVAGGKDESPGRECTPCYSLVRRYRKGERRSHAMHYDGHAAVTVVVSLSDYGGVSCHARVLCSALCRSAMPAAQRPGCSALCSAATLTRTWTVLQSDGPNHLGL